MLSTSVLMNFTPLMAIILYVVQKRKPYLKLMAIIWSSERPTQD